LFRGTRIWSFQYSGTWRTRKWTRQRSQFPGRTPYRNKFNSTGDYSPADWSKLSFEERNTIHKDRDKKGEPGGTNKRTIGDISVEQVTTIMGAIQQHNAATDTAESITPKTSNSQAGNAFDGKEGAKKQSAGGE
jgi:hypothetical protein